MNNMPNTKLESFIFTFITAWLMVYGMTVYNMALSTSGLYNKYFFIALENMWIEFIVVFLCAFFVVPSIARKLAFKIVEPRDRPIFIILCIQVFTVLIMVTIITAFIVIFHNGLTSQFVSMYIKSFCLNFVMAMPLQIFIVGPIARKFFRIIFRRTAI